MPHQSVLLAESLSYLAVAPGQHYIDCTFGAGGHTQAILEKTSPDGIVLALDVDPARNPAHLQKHYQQRIRFHTENFTNLTTAVSQKAPDLSFSGILLDLGVSSMQLDQDNRGFSFQRETPLDMRMGATQEQIKPIAPLNKVFSSLTELRAQLPTGELTAFHLVNSLQTTALAEIIKTYSEERYSRAIARSITWRRENYGLLQTTTDLVNAIFAGLPNTAKQPRRDTPHPATRTFQALRIAVNDELHALESVLEQAVNILAPGGRLVIISFHSLEDRIVKQFFKQATAAPHSGRLLPWEAENQHKATPTLKLCTTKPVTPSIQEIAQNPRSRSAKLRAAIKTKGA